MPIGTGSLQRSLPQELALPAPPSRLSDLPLFRTTGERESSRNGSHSPACNHSIS